MNLTGKTIVLTGASSGLGTEAARLLSARGAALHLVGRAADRLGSRRECRSGGWR